MKKILSFLVLVAAVVVLGLLTNPKTSSLKQTAGRLPSTLNTLGTSRTLVLPPAASANSPVISLGTTVDKLTGKSVEGYAFIHYKKESAKPSKTGLKCYGYISRGAKWRSIEPWLFNPSNLNNLDQLSLFDNFSNDVLKWENAAQADVLSNGSLVSDILAADLVSPDGQNEVYFADVSSSGAIAVTIVWGIFSGPLNSREIVEWDQVYDDVDFPWSLAGEASKMDFENIVTHELGHTFGLSDMYNSECGEVTMYGYSSYGETKKRTLESADITGVDLLY